MSKSPRYTGLAVISRAFTLNKLQHIAFCVVGTQLLERWRQVASSSEGLVTDEALRDPQLLFHLSGEGGTGKSRVIEALCAFMKAWTRPDCVVVTAMTGKAASLIGGRTLASLEATLASPSGRMAIQSVDVLIVDEVSMMSKYQLLRLDRLLRKAKRIAGVPFGGIRVLLAGDFLQLPPVGADSLLADPSHKGKTSLSDIEGLDLWHQFDVAVVLEASVRFESDPELGQGCSKARYGEWTDKFVEITNSRVVGEAPLPVSPSTEQTVFVTPDNETRTAINIKFIVEAAKILTKGEFPIRIIANFRGALNGLSQQDIMMVLSLPDSKFGRMAPYIDLIPGMPVQVTQNLRTKKGVANGTMGHLRSIQFPPNTAFNQVRNLRTGAVVILPSHRPHYALLRIPRADDAQPIGSNVDASLFPVFPDAEPYERCAIQLTDGVGGESRTLTIKIEQFPFVCALGATVYKVQGDSLSSMSAVDWKVDAKGANGPQQAYLMVSCVVNRAAFLSLQPFTRSLAEWSEPPAAAIEEDRRLRVLSAATVRSFYSSVDQA